MYGEFLFVAIYICALLGINAAEKNKYSFNKTINRSMVELVNKENLLHNNSNTIKEKGLIITTNLEDQEIVEPNQTNTPLVLNLIINLNFDDKKNAKSKLHKSQRRTRKNPKNEERKLNFNIEEQPKNKNPDNSTNIFEKIKLRMELQRKKRNIEYQNNDEAKIAKNTTQDNRNKIENIMSDDFPKMTILNDDEVDVTKWLKNWKDILAVNPFLSTDKPTKPEVEYIDEWKYSYRVTFYNLQVYNVSNFLCSGILVSPQWVLTSIFCKLGDEVTLLIGVHKLPKNILDYNRYGVLRRVESFSENLELIQIDRPVQWSFKTPDIRALKMEEMELLLRTGKCTLLSWMPVDIDKGIFELREYPELMLKSQNSQDLTKNSLKVTPLELYSSSKKDVGSPVLCDGLITSLVLNVEGDTMTVKMLCPVLEWITFFTREGSYFEVTARKFTLRNGAGNLRVHVEHCFYILVICLVWISERCRI